MTTPIRINAHEFAARAKKAEALAKVLLAVGASPDEVDEMTEEQWELAAAGAIGNVKPPNSQATKDLIKRIMERNARRPAKTGIDEVVPF